MPGPDQSWDQPEDPRESTLDLPRIDPASNGNGSANGGRAASSRQPDSQPPSHNGHSPPANGSPQWTAPPEPPFRHLPEVNGDPYAQPGRPRRPSPMFERPSRPDWTRPTPAMPPAPAAPPTAKPTPAKPTPSVPPAPAQPPPPVPPAPDTTRSSEPDPAPRAGSANRSRPPQPASSRPPEVQANSVRGREPDRRAEARPARGSLADLRSRLDRLPDGHPSSPYEDGGAAKPLPHRLKQLELGLPAPERDAVDAAPRLSRPGSDPREGEQASPTTRPARGPAADSPVGQPNAAALSGNGDAGDRAASRDSLGDPAAAPDTRHPANGTNGRRQDPADAGQDPYALPPPTANGSPRPASPPIGERHHERGRDRAIHDRNHTADARTQQYRELRSAAGPPASPPGSGELDNGQLSAVASELVASMLAEGRAAEGRTVSGSYGASGLTPVITRIAEQLSRGGLAPGSEATSLKSAERLSAKLARLIARHPDRGASELAASICDVVRYAFAFDPEYFTEGTWLVHRKLKAQGFEIEARRNRWESPEYKGIWTRWRDPASDLSFEIQFHTFASWEVIVGTHEAYRLITDPATSAAERARLRARQVAAAARAKAPPNCAEMADFSKGTR
jgi:hypothetical protein